MIASPGRARLVVPLAFWIGLVGAALALWLSGQAGSAWETMTDARLAPLAAVVLVGVALPLIHAARWRIVMRALETDLTPALAADITVSSSLVNYASPGYLGAPAKAFLANQASGAPYSRSIVSMAFEQGLDFLVLLVGSALALLVIGPSVLADAREAGTPPGWVWVLAAGCAIAVVAGGFVMRAAFRQAAVRIIEAFRLLGRRVDRLPVVGLTLVYWLAQALVVALLLWSLRLPLTLSTWLPLSTLPLMAGQVVPLPGGIGAREATIVALSRATGTSAASLLGLAVLQRVLLVAALPLSLALVRLGRSAGLWR